MGQMDVWNLNGITGNVITYDGRYDGAVNADGSDANAQPAQPVQPDEP